MSGFQNELEIAAQKDGQTWVTLAPFGWKNGHVYTVPRFFVTDFASVPRVVPTLLTGLLAWGLQRYLGTTHAWILAAVLASWAGLSPMGAHQWAAVVHDYLYWSQLTPRAEADKVFLDGMRDAGTPLFRRWAMYAAVRFCGRWAWWTNKKMRDQGVNRVLEAKPGAFERLPPTGIEKLILMTLGRTQI